MSRDLPVDTAREFSVGGKRRVSVKKAISIRSYGGQIVSDFVRGDVCELNGWQLSVTECRLAAVAFLLRTKGRYMEETAVRAEGPLDHLPNMTIVQLERWGTTIEQSRRAIQCAAHRKLGVVVSFSGARQISGLRNLPWFSGCCNDHPRRTKSGDGEPDSDAVKKGYICGGPDPDSSGRSRSRQAVDRILPRFDRRAH